MKFLSSAISACLIAASALCICDVGRVHAQDADGPLKNASDQIAQWIEDLDSGSFRTRVDASAKLKKAGDAAIPSLEKALNNSDGERKRRIEDILRELKKNSFDGRLRELAKAPLSQNAKGLPEWDRFQESVGDDRESVQFYVRLLKAEKSLFATAQRSSKDRLKKDLSALLEIRAGELHRSTRPAKPLEVDPPFSVDSYAALLLLAGNRSTRLIRGTSTSISALLLHKPFHEALKGPDGPKLLRLAGDYILRDGIGVSTPLLFARNHPFPRGLTLARRVLTKTLRGNDGLHAIMLLQEQGGTEDIALLESVFDNRGILFAGEKEQINNGGQQTVRQYVMYNGDLALAVAISMRERDPRDFGFAKKLPADQPYRFVFSTTGFISDEERSEARRKYAAEFLKDAE